MRVAAQVRHRCAGEVYRLHGVNKMLMMGATFISPSSVVDAQTYVNTGLGITFSGLNCQRVAGTTVDCSLVGSYTAAGNDTATGTFFRNTEGRVTLADGTVIVATQVAGGGNDYTTLAEGIVFNRGIPTKLTWRFDGVPATVTTLRGVALVGLAVPNVRLGGTAAAPDPALHPVILNAGSYNAVLTSCKAASSGTVTCIATLTPSK